MHAARRSKRARPTGHSGFHARRLRAAEDCTNVSSGDACATTWGTTAGGSTANGWGCTHRSAGRVDTGGYIGELDGAIGSPEAHELRMRRREMDAGRASSSRARASPHGCSGSGRGRFWQPEPAVALRAAERTAPAPPTHALRTASKWGAAIWWRCPGPYDRGVDMIHFHISHLLTETRLLIRHNETPVVYIRADGLRAADR